MTKWLKYATAKASPVYEAIVGVAIDRLTTVGMFEKSDVLTASRFDVFDDASIRWDYIKRIIEEEYSTELIPLAAVFFKSNQRNGRKDSRHGPEHPPSQFPGRYIASGYGKKTAGFCIASSENEHFVVHRLKMIRGAAIGKLKKGNQTLAIGKRAGIRRLRGVPPAIMPPPLNGSE